MGTHYEERLQHDLEAIQQLVNRIGEGVSRANGDAVRAVLAGDKDLAADTVIGDYAINRLTRELDRRCHAFVARHLPGAGHLRYVSSVMRLAIGLERIGDYAATIARTAGQLTAPPPAVVARDLTTMVEHARRILGEALDSFRDRDVAQAQAMLVAAAQFAPYFDRVFADLVAEGEAHSRPAGDLFALMATFNRLDRVVHQAKNIGEETIFAATGHTKGEKVFHILFVDEQNSGPSQLAEHFARKAYPHSGRYRSAGWAPAEEIDPTWRRFADTVGIDLAKAWPAPLAALRDQLDQFHLVVGIGRGVREQLGRVPFHTTVLAWDLDARQGPEAVYRLLTPRLGDLMERLRGAEAS